MGIEVRKNVFPRTWTRAPGTSNRRFEMELFEAIKNRRSVRKYKKGEVISRETLEEIVDAGNRAPSGRSVNPWRFVVITERENIDKLQEVIGNNGRFLLDASAAIITLSEDTKYFLEDGCAATENMLLAIHGKGLGGCWIAGDKKDYCPQILEFLGAPPEMKVISIISVGVPDETPVKQKPELGEVLKWEKY